MALEKIALEDDYFVTRKLYPNVDFYSGIVQKAIGIPVSLFTAIFALARTVGWIAQLNEMITDPEYKIGRPRQLFAGAKRRSVTRHEVAQPVSDDARIAGLRPVRMRGHDHEHDARIRVDQHALRRQRAVHRGAVRALPRESAAGPADWRAYFDGLRGGAADVAHAPVIESFIRLGKSRKVSGAMIDAATMHKQVLVLQLIGKFRTLGMFQAEIDPLKRQEKRYIADLDLSTYGFTDADLDTEFDVGSFKAGAERMRLRDLIDALKDTYCRTFGAEYMYISDTSVKRFVQQRLEPIRSRPTYTPEERRHILERLTAAETLERYLHTKYVGQKRFSGEGGDTLIPMLDHLIQKAGVAGVQETVIGMAHRGRLTVLVNTFGKMPADLFSEFEGKQAQALVAGDVKYHQGFSSDVVTPGGPMHLTLAFNPSHLEAVDPVVEGSVRARQHRRGDEIGDQVLPVLIHGDAAVAGQGVIQEILNMAQTRGYYTGGTIHIVVNNQIGFTTSDPRDTRGTLYCTDIAKMAEAPIFHVNADDPEVCLLAVEMAMEFRRQFHRDVFIDLVCFRRLGHNEADEPMVTQPLMYKKINQHPGTRKLYADVLVRDGVIKPDDADAMIATYRAAMDKGLHTNTTILSNYKAPFSVDWTPYKGRSWTDPCDTTVPMDKLKALAQKVVDGARGLQAAFARRARDRRPQGDGRRQAAARLGDGARRSPTRRSSIRTSACVCPARTSPAARFRTDMPCCTTRTAKNGTRAPGFRSSTSNRASRSSKSSIRC